MDDLKRIATAEGGLEVTGAPDAAALDAAWELGASLAALLATGVA